MNNKLQEMIKSIQEFSISDERKEILQPYIDFIQSKLDSKEEIRLNFICTHNSRKSHFSQIWLQSMAFYFEIPAVFFCYSGGTEATTMFPKVAETLTNQGFQIQQLSEALNPVYAVKYDKDLHPIICFSKTYDDVFNPKSKFAAIITCSSADQGCPFITGAEKRIAVQYEDPKAFDEIDLMNEKYAERSLEIASKMYYAFSQIKK